MSIDELVDAIGVDAARYFLVARSHDQPMDIDVDLAREQSSKNPVYYVQYAHARIRSILRKELAQGEQTAPDAAEYEPQRQERDVIKRLAEWPSVVQEAAERRAPHRVVAWVHDLAADFHVVHHDLLVLDPDPVVRGFRLALARATGDTIRSALALIGVEAPDAMHRDPGPEADQASSGAGAALRPGAGCARRGPGRDRGARASTPTTGSSCATLAYGRCWTRRGSSASRWPRRRRRGRGVAAARGRRRGRLVSCGRDGGRAAGRARHPGARHGRASAAPRAGLRGLGGRVGPGARRRAGGS